MDSYKTISEASEAVIKDRGSKFIAVAMPVKTEEEVKAKLEEIKKEYHDATHYCYAYRLGYDKSVCRSNDDGEPSGTAGKPIYNQILSKDLTNILIVVIRYFGGTKLGVSGLINAYKTSAKNALDKAKIITKTVREVYELNFGYELMNIIMNFIKNQNIEQLSHEFKDCGKIVIAIGKNNSSMIIEKFKSIQGVDVKFLKIE